jgi:hypothetical protein
VAYGREPQKLLNAIAAIEAYTRQLLSWSVRYRHNKKVYEAMVKLRNSLNVAIENFENET